MKSFITNSGSNELKKRITELIQKSDELKFLVGFFYFSGIRELYEGLKTKQEQKIKVLVGLSVDCSNYGLQEISDITEGLSNAEITDKFFESIRKSLNTEYFDNQDFYEQIRFFVSLIREDKLIIRKTSKPNHAKLYLFKLEEGQVGKRELFITGSSNLTRAGLLTQSEFNVEISDYGFTDAEEYFDSLWGNAQKITEYEDTKKKLIELVEFETLVKEVTPFEAYCLVIKTYLDSFRKSEIDESLKSIMESKGYKPYKYQLDAVKQALTIIEQDNGVIVADVVGLGKSIIASAIAKELGKRGVIICPPGLIGNINSGWVKYAEEFKLYDWEVRSLGDLENTLEFVQKAANIEVVIIDEAHRFRNQDTKDYELLKNICRGKIVILLTATPFNNRPSDILSLLKLFITSKKSAITLENNIVDKFRSFKGTFEKLGYIKKYRNSPDENKRNRALRHYISLFGEGKVDLKKVAERSRYLAGQIRDIIEPVTIRRNRLDLENNPDFKDEVSNLSKVANPKEWFFRLTKEQSVFYDTVIQSYFGDPDEGGLFKGAIYRPFEYEKQKKDEDKRTEEENRQFIQQRNLFDFMRRLLVKRFESSFGSFVQSIKNFRRISINVQSFIKKTGEYILDRDLIEKIYDLSEDEIGKYLIEYEEKISKGEYPKNHKRYKLKDFDDKDGFIEAIDSDIKLFGEILQNLAQLDLAGNDPKTSCLIEEIEKELNKQTEKSEPRRKIVIFSEYLDTVEYLKPHLEKKFKDRLLVIAGDLSAHKITLLNKNFDASFPEQDDSFDILLATDKISEGFNLNRAGMVINYDIPWNPVRVIQRLGRINRISKKVFKELYIVNFFPTEQGAELVKSREIAQNKMYLIHNTLGEDSKIFDIDETPAPSALYNRIQENPDKCETESFYTKVLRTFISIKEKYPELIASLNKFPPLIKVAKSYSENELLLFIRKGRLYVHAIKYGNDSEPAAYKTSIEDVFSKIQCDRDEKALPLSPDFWKAYEKVKSFKDNREVVLSEQSLEQKALNNLSTFINQVSASELIPFKDFLRTLREDILNYGTLSDYTLRRISNLAHSNDKNLKYALAEISKLREELGNGYLIEEKARLKNLSREIIIAIENVKR